MSDPLSASDSELSAEDLELLGRVRRERQQGSVPSAIRQRLFTRVLEEAKRGYQGLPVPAAQFVPVQRWELGYAIWLSSAMALCLVLLTNAPRWLLGSPEPSTTEEGPSAIEKRPSARSAGAPARIRGERLLDMPLFRAPAQPLPSAAFPPAGPNLFGEQPFSAQSASWQVRRWDDLGADPVEGADHDFEEGALCVLLGAGERVLGGWPWASRAVSPPGLSSKARAPKAAAPKAAALIAGKPYRLAFKAWAREPLPAQLLIAVGHAQLPFSAAAGARVAVSTAPRPFVVDFVSPRDDPAVGIAFLASNAAGGERTRVCLSHVTLTDNGPS